MEDFEIPEEADDFPITPAEEILRQTRRSLGTGEYVVYSIYTLDPDFTGLASEVLLGKINELTKVISKDYIWSRDTFELHVVHDVEEDDQNGNQFYFLQGCTIYADCIEDEWFIVYLLHNISCKFPDVLIQIVDRDGEFLLIEGADVLPKWLKPENAFNRVWMRYGQLSIVYEASEQLSEDLDEGLDIFTALKLMSDSAYINFVHSALTNCLSKKISVYPEQSIVSRHNAMVILPRRIASALAGRPHLVSATVTALCDGETGSVKDISSIEAAALNDMVIATVTMSKLQYAQLTFQNFRPPEALVGIKKRLGRTDEKLIKAIDIGLRLVCGLEGAYQKSIKMRNSKLIQNMSSFYNLNYEDNVDRYLKEWEYRYYGNFNEAVNSLLEEQSHSGASFPSAASISRIPALGDSDAWLYMSPEDMDKEMNDKVNEMKGLKRDDSKPSKASSETSNEKKTPDNNAERLSEIVKGLETFVAGTSGLDGVELGAEGDDMFSDDEDTDISSECSTDETDPQKDMQDTFLNGGTLYNADDDGDIILNMEKLENVLHDYHKGKYDAPTKKKADEKKGNKKSSGRETKHFQRGKTDVGRSEISSLVESEPVCGTSVYLLTEQGPAVKVDEIIASIGEEESKDSDDESENDNEDEVSNSNPIGSLDDSVIENELFYKEYQDALDGELSGTTLFETFVRKGVAESSSTGNRSSLNRRSDSCDQATPPVDEELNMLQHLLESHASQMGAAGPISNLLSVMGIQLPVEPEAKASAESK